MRNPSIAVKILVTAALVLTVLIFVPIISQAETVIYSGNNATGIQDLDVDGVLYDVTFVFDTGINVYGFPGDFIFNQEDSSTEELAYAAARAMQIALNSAPVKILTVGPNQTDYFYLATAEDPVDPAGDPEGQQFYGAYESKYDDRIQFKNAWGPADRFPLGVVTPTPYNNAPWSYAKVTLAGSGPPPPDASVGGDVTGLLGSGLVLQNNGGDDETITGDGPFTFNTNLTPGTPYLVTVATQPSSPAQFCTVARGNGSVHPQGVDDVLVTCTDPPEPPVNAALLPAINWVLNPDAWSQFPVVKVKAANTDFLPAIYFLLGDN